MEERVLLHSNCSIYRVMTKECTDGACMVQEESCMTKEEILSGFDNSLHELKSYREGKLELKPLEDVLNEL
jgi:hypothetical protein